jgi:UDP:flavonoid glycosyltransferase YjiC (YdhE family)
MTGLRVLFTATPGWGHINPMMPLARAFVSTGDDVLWATGPDAAARLEAAGFRAAPVGLTQAEAMGEFDRRFPELHTLPRPEWPDFMFPRLFGESRVAPMLDGLLPAARAWSPDLVVSDAAEFAGPIVAAAEGVANVTHSFGALVPAHRVAAAGDAVAGLRASVGPAPSPFGGCYEHLYLDICPPSLQPGPMDHVGATQLLRPSDGPSSADTDLPALVTAEGQAPLLYLTFGTVFTDDAALATLVAAIRDHPVRLVVTVGPDGDPAALGPQPDNVHVARYIPQDRLLGRCRVVVSHAGSGTFLAALAAGLPQLCLPQAADQFLNAAACARTGIGLAIEPGDVTADRVRDAVERLLADPAFREAARRGRDEIAAMPSAAEVAATLRDRFHSA